MKNKNKHIVFLITFYINMFYAFIFYLVFVPSVYKITWNDQWIVPSVRLGP